ncbi:MAG: hypothetical protein WDW36_009430 [Sanguina aurantia]
MSTATYTRISTLVDSDDDADNVTASAAASEMPHASPETPEARPPRSSAQPSPAAPAPAPVSTGLLIDFEDDSHVSASPAAASPSDSSSRGQEHLQPPHTDTGDPSSEAEEEPKAPRPTLDFTEQDSVAMESRELLIYAIPLMRDKLIYLPVSSWTEAPTEHTGWRKKIQGQIGVLQGKAQDTWDGLKAAEPGTMKNKVYEVGRSVVENLSPEERLLRSIPKNVTKVIIRHPLSVPPDEIMEELTQTTTAAGMLNTTKATVAGLVLPLAMTIDAIIIPGPSILTYCTLFKMYTSGSVAQGGQRLTAYISQEGKANNVRVNYCGEPRLDKYLDWVNDQDDGVLEEEQIEQLCVELGEPELLHHLIELRARHLRMNTTTKFASEYTLISDRRE